MKKTAGFSLIGIIIAVVAVVAVGFVGWRVYDANNNPVQEANDSSTPSSSPTEKDQTTYLTINELGVRFKLSEEIKDATYSVKTLNDGSQVATFSTAALTAQDAECNAGFGPLGSLEKTTVDTDRFGNKKVVDNVTIFKINDNYYSYSSPQALCSEKIADTESGYRLALKEALKTIEAIR